MSRHERKKLFHSIIDLNAVNQLQCGNLFYNNLHCYLLPIYSELLISICHLFITYEAFKQHK